MKLKRMITNEEKVQALSQIHPDASDLDYIERWFPGCLAWFQEKLTEPIYCVHKHYLRDLIFELELSHRLGLEPRTGILLQPIFRRLLSFLCIHHLADRLALPVLLDALEWPPGGGRSSRITSYLNHLTSEPIDPQAIEASESFAQAHPTPPAPGGIINVTVTETPAPPDAGAHGGQGEPDEIDELLNVTW